MPTYDYFCNNCREEFEIFLMRVIRDEDKRCPRCGSFDVTPVYKEFNGYASYGGSGSCGSAGSGFSFG